MKHTLLLCFFVLVVSFNNLFASYLVSNLNCSVTNSSMRLEWYQPRNYTNAYLYYNVYSSSNSPKFDNGIFVNFLDFDLIGVVKYSTNNPLSFVISNCPKYYYLVLPATNGVFVYDDFYSLVIPKITNTNFISNTNFTFIVKETNQIRMSEVSNVTIEKTTNVLEKSNTVYLDKLGYILKTFFFKGKYRASLDKLIEIRSNVSNDEERELIDLYIARCYYALGKKRKAIRILLNINDPEIREMSEFWLNRFSRYF